VIDADAVYHQLLQPPSPCLDALRIEFGDSIIASDGTLDRTALGALVFEDSDVGRARRSRLNAITHGFVAQRIDQLLREYQAAGKKAALIDAPLLIEAGIHRQCHFNVCVLAPEDVRLARLMARDGRDRNAILARMKAQPDDDFYRSHTDAVIFNHGCESDVLREQVTDILRCSGVIT
jgi:dephospho-CoA kinase